MALARKEGLCEKYGAFCWNCAKWVEMFASYRPGRKYLRILTCPDCLTDYTTIVGAMI